MSPQLKVSPADASIPESIFKAVKETFIRKKTSRIDTAYGAILKAMRMSTFQRTQSSVSHEPAPSVGLVLALPAITTQGVAWCALSRCRFSQRYGFCSPLYQISSKESANHLGRSPDCRDDGAQHESQQVDREHRRAGAIVLSRIRTALTKPFRLPGQQRASPVAGGS